MRWMPWEATAFPFWHRRAAGALAKPKIAMSSSCNWEIEGLSDGGLVQYITAKRIEEQHAYCSVGSMAGGKD